MNAEVIKAAQQSQVIIIEDDLEISPPASNSEDAPGSSSEDEVVLISKPASRLPEKRPRSPPESVVRRPPAPFKPPSKPSQPPSLNSATNHQGWICTTCTFINPKPLALACEVCETVRPSNISSSALDEFWQCEDCGEMTGRLTTSRYRETYFS